MEVKGIFQISGSVSCLDDTLLHSGSTFITAVIIYKWRKSTINVCVVIACLLIITSPICHSFHVCIDTCQDTSLFKYISLLGRFGIPNAYCFCCQPSYWCDAGHEHKNYDDVMADSPEVDDIEPVSPELHGKEAIRYATWPLVST